MPALKRTRAPVQVVLADDGSGPPWTAAYEEQVQAYGLRLLQPEANLGRVGIRNYMAERAETEWLLFLDVDSQIPDADFLRRYVEASGEADVVAGGTAYTAEQPGAGSLRHRYGMARERVHAAVRRTAPYARLALNNLLIRRSTFWAAGGLDAAVQGYGHEDTLLGKQLERLGARIVHIDNPVVHTGLEEDAVFLRKSEEAARNLARLYRAEKLTRQEARLIDAALHLRRWGLGWMPGIAGHLFPDSTLTGLDLRKLAAFLDERGR